MPLFTEFAVLHSLSDPESSWRMVRFRGGHRLGSLSQAPNKFATAYTFPSILFIMKSQGKSKIDRFYPTACFELFSAPTSSYLVTVLQIFGSVVYFITYELLEKYGYIHRGSSLRFSVYITAISYALGGITAVTGILTKRRNLVLYNIWIMQALMFITDIVAVSIILIMAIGNRWELTYTLPRQFVNEQKFYGILGPFWMYLGAISLHITVAINMCFLQVFNTYLKFLDSKPSVESSQPLKLNNNNNNNNIRS